MSYVLGIDAGGTKTLALVARLDGSIVGSGRGGCGDIYATPTADDALDAVDEAATQAMRVAGIRPTDLAAGGFSMAGADWPEDFVLLQDELAQRTLGRSVIVVNDAIGALRAAIPSGPGVVVVCGTGIATGARGAGGHTWHTSFWQEPHGSHQLGEKTLRAVYRAELGIDPPTSLTGRVLALFEQPTVDAVLHQLTAWRGQPLTRMQAGLLTRALLDEATRGDMTAWRLIQQHGAAIGDYVMAAARRVGIAGMPFTLALAGGVLRHSEPLLANAIAERVQVLAPAVRVVASRFEPIVGALFLALDAAGVMVDAALLERLERTLPATAFYAT